MTIITSELGRIAQLISNLTNAPIVQGAAMVPPQRLKTSSFTRFGSSSSKHVLWAGRTCFPVRNAAAVHGRLLTKE